MKFKSNPMTAQQQAKTPFTQNPMLCSNIIHDFTNSHILAIYNLYITFKQITKFSNVFNTDVYRFQLLCLRNKYNILRRVKKGRLNFNFPNINFCMFTEEHLLEHERLIERETRTKEHQFCGH